MSSGSGGERPDPLQVEAALQEELAQVADEQTRALLLAWALAWSQLSSTLMDALPDEAVELGRITHAMIVRVPRLQRALALVADRLVELTREAGVSLTADLDAVVELGVRGGHELMAAQVPDRPDAPDVPGDPVAVDLQVDPPGRYQRPSNPTLDALIRRLTTRIESQTSRLADDAYDAVQRSLIDGVVAGDNPRTTARQMVDRAEGAWNLSLDRATTIARTEIVDAYREGARVTQDANADVLAGWLWLAHLGPRTCRSCLAMHGRIFTLDQAGPEDHPQGRCSRMPVVRDEDGRFDVSFVPDADLHFESLDQADQQAILGMAGWKAWRAGEFPREVWTKRRENPQWRASQVPARPGDADAGTGIPPTAPSS